MGVCLEPQVFRGAGMDEDVVKVARKEEYMLCITAVTLYFFIRK